MKFIAAWALSRLLHGAVAVWGMLFPSLQRPLSSLLLILTEYFTPYLNRSQAPLPGQAVEGKGDLGIALRNGSLALGVTASRLSLRGGLVDPLVGGRGIAASQTAPSLKATLAKEFSPDSFLAISYDLKLRQESFCLSVGECNS